MLNCVFILICCQVYLCCRTFLFHCPPLRGMCCASVSSTTRVFVYFIRVCVLWTVATCLPWLGYLCGYSIARLLCQPHRQSLTIGLETGIQNVGVPIVILLFSMPKPEGDLGAIVPVVIALSGPIPLYVWFIGITNCCLLMLIGRVIADCVLTVKTIKKKCHSNGVDAQEESNSTVILSEANTVRDHFNNDLKSFSFRETENSDVPAQQQDHSDSGSDAEQSDTDK